MMKLLNFLLIILLWNTTYRCKKDELTIDCTDACNKMIGTWKGNQYSNNGGFSEQFILKLLHLMDVIFMVRLHIQILLPLFMFQVRLMNMDG